MYDQFLKELGLKLRPSANNLQVNLTFDADYNTILTLTKGQEKDAKGIHKAYVHFLVQVHHAHV